MDSEINKELDLIKENQKILDQKIENLMANFVQTNSDFETRVSTLEGNIEINDSERNDIKQELERIRDDLYSSNGMLFESSTGEVKGVIDTVEDLRREMNEFIAFVKL